MSDEVLEAMRRAADKIMASKPRPQDVAKTLEAADRFRRQQEEAQRRRDREIPDYYYREMQMMGKAPLQQYNEMPIIVTPDRDKAIDAMAQRVSMSPTDFRVAVQDLFEKDLKPVIEAMARQMVMDTIRQTLTSDLRAQLRAFVTQEVQKKVKVNVTVGPEIDNAWGVTRAYAGLAEDE